MATIVFGGGVSHSPMLTLPPDEWKERGEADFRNPGLNLSDGRFVNYSTLLAEVGDKYRDVATEEVFTELSRKCQSALDRFADGLAASEPDVIVVVGDDHMDMFSPENIPAVSIFYGEKLVTLLHKNFDKEPPWAQGMWREYMQDKQYSLPGHREFALDLIRLLSDEGVDIAISSHVPEDGSIGIGHSYGFVAKRLMKQKSIPMVPVMLNTYYPPNVPSARRCLAIGRALRRAVEASPSGGRVAIVASGGLSHFVVDESLDRFALEHFMADSADALGTIDRNALHSGSSEILNWVLTAGAIEGLPPQWQEYYPIYRTPAGSGIGIAMAARW